MSNLDFDGMKGDGVNRGKNRFAGNHSGKTAPVNVGRGPTKGNQDYDVGQGTHREPPTRALPALQTGKEMFTGTSQYRGAGGTSIKKPGAEAKINVGRGPTKGNQQ